MYSTTPPHRSFAVLWTLLLVAVLAFAFQGSRGLWGPDEGRYTNVALQMVESGDWLVPRRHDEHMHFTKPPLTYWAIAASVSVFGANEWAMRLPGACATLLSAWGMLLLGRTWVPRRPWLPVLIHATTLLPFVAGNIASTDNLLAAFETLAMVGFVRLWALPAGQSAAPWQALMWAGFGLAILTKGPPGLLPLLAMVVFLWRERRLDPAGLAATLRLFHPAGLLLFALIALPWFVAVIVKVPGLWAYLIGDEVVGRVFTDMHDRNPQWYGAFVVYGPVLLVGILPWSAVWWRAAPRLWQRIRTAGWRTALRVDSAEERILWYWLLLPLLVFCLARSRLALYLLPLCAPFALLIARQLECSVVAVRTMPLALWMLFLLGLKGYAGVMHYGKDTRSIAADVGRNWGVRPTEIVFVQEPALYGLRHYLGVQVERVSLKSEPDPKFDETLVEELADDEGPRLWITTADRVSLLEQAVHAQGYLWRRLGQHERYVYGTLERVRPAIATTP